MALICDPIISAAITGTPVAETAPTVDVTALQAEIEALRAQIAASVVAPVEVAPVVDEVTKPAPKTK